jgi:hypothetical protein
VLDLLLIIAAAKDQLVLVVLHYQEQSVIAHPFFQKLDTTYYLHSNSVQVEMAPHH